jgi:hypothetical protein
MAHNYDIDNIFTYHPPFGNQAERYEHIRNYAKALARTILTACPESAERTLALRKIEESVMWANSSIARNEKPPAEGGA